MITPLLITWIVLIAAITLLLSDRVRPDLVALMVAIVLGLTGVLTTEETFSGFSRSAVITILAVFILADGLQQTGVTDHVGKLLVRVSGNREKWLAITVTLAGAFLSLFMNNIAAASVLLPAVSGAARKAKANPAKLLIPLAFGTMLGGMATLFTTTNIVVSSLLRDNGLKGFGVLDFLPLGIPIVLAGVLYLSLVAQRLLPSQPPAHRLLGRDEVELASIYRLDERFIRARIQDDSPLVGVSLEKSNLREVYNLNVVAIERDGQRIFSPSPETLFTRNDLLLLEGKQEDLVLKKVNSIVEVLPVGKWREEDLETPQFTLVETVLAPRSPLIGLTLREAHFREKFRMTVLGFWKSGRPIRTGLSDLPLQFGDALLLHGPRENIPVLQSESGLILLTNEPEMLFPNPQKALLSMIVMVVTLAIAAFSSISIGEVMLGGALVMVLLGVVSMDQAYRAVEWKSVALIAGMLPLGIAMTKTGAAAVLADRLLASLGPSGPMAVLAGLITLSILLTLVMNGAAVAVIIAPIAIQMAQKIGVDPRAMAMGIALATSMAFITPLGHPVNVLVMGPGGYRFRDYVKVGLPLTVLLFIVVIFLLPVFWPFTHQ